MPDGLKQWIGIAVGALVFWNLWPLWGSFITPHIPPGRYPMILLMALSAVPPLLVGVAVAFIAYGILELITRDAK